MCCDSRGNLQPALEQLDTSIDPVVKLLMTVEECECNPVRPDVFHAVLPENLGNAIDALDADVDTE